MQNCLARVVTRSPHFLHSLPLLKSLHWFPVRYRIIFKICTITYQALSSKQPAYISLHGNDKPWFTRDIKQKLTEKNATFISGSREEFRRAKCEVQKAVKKAKFEHKRKREDNFALNNTIIVWQGLQQITQYKQSAAVTDYSDPSFPDQLNDFTAAKHFVRAHFQQLHLCLRPLQSRMLR